MTNWLNITLIVLSQIAIVEAIYIIFFMSRKKQEPTVDIRMAKEMFAGFVQNNERKHKTLKALHDVYELEDALSKSRLTELLQLENLLEKSIIEAIAKGDLKYIDKVHDALDKLVSFYTSAAIMLKETLKDKYNGMRSEFSRLEADRDKLRDELATTLDTMNQTLDEYSEIHRARKQTPATTRIQKPALDPLNSLSGLDADISQMDRDLQSIKTLDLGSVIDDEAEDIPELTDIVDEQQIRKR